MNINIGDYVRATEWDDTDLKNGCDVDLFYKVISVDEKIVTVEYCGFRFSYPRHFDWYINS